MESRLIALKLFIDELGIEFNIDSVDDRKLIQKAVYLGQLKGADLGFRFGWYIKGPYCPDLTKDYYSLDEALAIGDNEAEKNELVKPIRERLEKIRPLLEVPKELQEEGMEQHDWLELVSSVHYLSNISRLSEKKAREELKNKKPDLFKFYKEAKRALQENDLPLNNAN